MSRRVSWVDKLIRSGEDRRNFVIQLEVPSLRSMSQDLNSQLPSSSSFQETETGQNVQQAEQRLSTATAQDSQANPFFRYPRHQFFDTNKVPPLATDPLNTLLMIFNTLTSASSSMIRPKGAVSTFVKTSQPLLAFKNVTVNSAREETQNCASQQRTENAPGSRYSCSQCGMPFENDNDLREHRAYLHNIYECAECAKIFPNRSSLTLHMGSHNRPFECPQCHKKFTQHGHLKIHMRIHTGEKPYVCGECNRTFTQNSSLKYHKRIHTGEKPYVCDVCNRTFTKSSNLISHRRIHTGEKPYVCDVCNRKFTQISTLIQHKRSHTGEKPYRCDKCGKQFATSRNCRIHMERKHAGE